jgi:hypothetical protein
MPHWGNIDTLLNNEAFQSEWNSMPVHSQEKYEALIEKYEAAMDKDDNGEKLDVNELEPDEQAAYFLAMAREKLKSGKPNDRSPKDRHWAVTLTELEKVIAYFDYWVFRDGDE